MALSSGIKIEGKGKPRLAGPSRNVKLSNMELNEKMSVKILLVFTLCHLYALYRSHENVYLFRISMNILCLISSFPIC